MSEESKLAEDQPTTDWHLDKRVPAAIIGAIMIQTIGFVSMAAAYIAKTDADIVSLKTLTASLPADRERMVRVETKLDIVADTTQRIDDRLNRK